MELDHYYREGMVAVMAGREETYHKFGPILTEGICLVLLDEINTLRNEQGMPEITEQDIIDRLNNHLSHLEPYDWMKEHQE
ncbi:hypothetical protein ES703_43430 [subsurface metagenome]